jgi:cyanobactin maturation PatA/PatG family protease
LVYALGLIGFDLISEARLDSLVQQIAAFKRVPPDRGLAFDQATVLDYLDANPWDAPSFEWTLLAEGTPLYAIRPQGPFAGEAYQRLRTFLREQLTEGVDRVSVPGVLAGRATLLLGQVVPVLAPELRGMYSWSTAALVGAVIGPAPGERARAQQREEYERKRIGVTNFLERVYHELRNLGVQPAERAINFAATNAFQAGEAYASVLRENMELDTVRATPSSLCRPGSDCWDVEVYFFYPERQVQTVRRVFRFTVDVSDVVPVTVGPVRTWTTR